MSDPATEYNRMIGEYSAHIARLQHPLRWIPWVRLLLFILTGTLLYHSVAGHTIVLVTLSVLAFSGFLLAGWYDSRLKKGIREQEILIRICNEELAATSGDFSAFDTGERFIDQGHPYTHDLDIFGQGSLYQCINRSCTALGEEKIAGYLRQGFMDPGTITGRQQAVAELAGMVVFRHRLRLIISGMESAPADLNALVRWLENEEPVPWGKFLKAASWVLPLVTAGTILVAAFGWMPWTLPLFLLSLQLILVFAAARMTMVVHQDVSSYVGILRKYAGAFTLLETTEFTSEFNRALKETLHSGHADMPGLVIRRLSALLNMLDANLNMLVSVILNGLFMFNIHVVFAVERWRKRHRLAVPVWFSVLAEFDALSGLAAFTFNNPGYTFPEPVGGDFTFVASALGHPLIHSSACVTNDIEITGWNQFRIITGANMSGKSTFLRSVGTNLILAMAGAPVFAGRLTFLPVEIHSSIRTNDSLAKRESYFYAELRRLKEMIADLEQGRQKLILLDEILKGTNSSDKQTGSVALIRQLLKYPVTGLFATHDLSLGELVHNYPGNIRNLCFEIRITGDRMEIDYKLVPGVSRNLNASYLMRKMGIIPDN